MARKRKRPDGMSKKEYDAKLSAEHTANVKEATLCFQELYGLLRVNPAKTKQLLGVENLPKLKRYETNFQKVKYYYVR